jgi:glucan-binding YG repeat protein
VDYKRRIPKQNHKSKLSKSLLVSGLAVISLAAGIAAPVKIQADQSTTSTTGLTVVSRSSAANKVVATTSVSASASADNASSKTANVNSSAKTATSLAPTSSTNSAAVTSAENASSTDETTAVSSSSSTVESSVENNASSQADSSTSSVDESSSSTVTSSSSSAATAASSTANTTKTVVAKTLLAAESPVSFDIGDSRYTEADAIDVSSYQSWLNRLSQYQELKSLGIKTVIIKITQGTDYTNPYAAAAISLAHQVGLNIAVYHFATFSTQKSGYAEGEYAAGVMKSLGLSTTTLIFADMEATSTYSSTAKDNLNSFWSALSAAGYSNHGVYTFASYEDRDQVVATVGKARTWLAQYPYIPTKDGSYEKEWEADGYGGWQFSSRAYLPGYESEGYIDVSHDFDGLITQSGFQKYLNGHWYLLDIATGAKKTGFQYISNQHKTVYYNSKGQMQYGQQKINGYWYLFDSATGAKKTGFQYISNQHKTVYYNSKGQMQYGQQKINGYWYLFDSATGAKKTGFQYISNQHKTVYYNSKGQMQYGQQKINGYWYLFDSATGAKKTGFQYISNQHKTVYYNSKGQMLYGRQKINGKIYNFDPVTGAKL